ncbi:phosphocarrier protein HPr [Kurthia sibirica]|uniref:Phosphocarrier protein HPr n=1 Tax=Kurthia sibirica TaxID=202750 RepID=A0A2U3AIH6_9BACL|nr:phosphocarrier protein HPr [Kurthia sibirica]PWI24356.1 phosphocarrier protein HPr [Kurthia sibirica]GEK33358.1 phosphocarrier protein HPr [Kurthia sibirica]
MEKQFKITSPEGLHARPCTLLVAAVTPFSSDVKISYNDRAVNLKSIMGVMALGIPTGANITISAEGADAEAAIEKAASVISNENIGEEA